MTTNKHIHNVFWGTHGCQRTKGHANPCKCWCNQTLPSGHKYVFGDDVNTAVFDPNSTVDSPQCTDTPDSPVADILAWMDEGTLHKGQN